MWLVQDFSITRYLAFSDLQFGSELKVGEHTSGETMIAEPNRAEVSLKRCLFFPTQELAELAMCVYCESSLLQAKLRF